MTGPLESKLQVVVSHKVCAGKHLGPQEEQLLYHLSSPLLMLGFDAVIVLVF